MKKFVTVQLGADLLQMLKQVWINLLDNAIKFSPIDGKIEIRIKETVDIISVLISAQRNGMSPETQKHIFDKFYQGDLSHSSNGNGLGLTIVKKLIDLHGDNIVVHSSDKGSSFNVSLKLTHRRGIVKFFVPPK